MANQDLLKTIQHVRGRWKLALVLRGTAICVIAGLLLLALSALGFAQFGFNAQTIVTLRWTVGLAALAVFVAAVLIPALRMVSDERVALYIEEREPALQSLLISAIETPAAESGIARALVERAAAQCRDIGYGARIEQRRLKRNGFALAGAIIIATVVIGAGPSPLRNSARALLLPMPAAQAAGVMSIVASPGNDTIARGADIAISAELHGFNADEANVIVRDSSGEWKQWSMSPARERGKFEAVLFDVSRATDYYIEANMTRSPTYRIEVVDAPYVKSLTLEYQYPAYTGLPARRIEDAGDIVAPKGTIVRIIALTSGPAAEGRLRLADARTIRMQPASAGELQTTMRVLSDGLYHIELPGIDGRMASASAQYAITAIADNAPTVRIDKPGRDVKVNAVDEVFVSASADDDYGISKLELIYSVNGAPQQTKSLAAPGASRQAATGAHTFFLEELSLKPGDFVSYFVRASDNNAIDGARSASTDIYFVQIKPYSREYRESQQAGMPGQQEDQGSLSEQQRQVIAATFNISRDRATYTEQGYREALTTVELSQKKLREQVQTLLQRMQMRGVTAMDTIFKQISELLPQAAREMSAAEDRLQKQRPDEALTPEQKSLQQLLRAEALYREVQIQMQQQQQAGGGGTPPEDLADLFDLDRDQLRNQYEQVQRSQEEQTQRQVDETLERLRELARRQQQEAERQRQAAQRGQQQQGGAGSTGGAQRRLADEAEETARQLERLAREQNNGEMQDAARRLREAADAMRRASSQRDGRGLADANSARERLNEAQRRLQQNQRESLQQRVDEARRRAEQLREQQRGIAQDAEQVSGSQNGEQIRQLNEQKNQLGQGVAELENRLDRMSAEARGTNRDAARQLQQAADGIRDARLRERIRATQQNPQLRSREFNRAQEEQISRDLDRLNQQLAQASAASGQQSPENRGRAAAEDAREMAEGVEGMRNRARASQQQQASPNGSANAQGQSRSGGAASSEVNRQLRAEARERAGELRELQRQLQQQGMNTESLESALEALRSLQSAGAYDDPEEIERLLAKVSRGLQDFEFNLRQALQDSTTQKLYQASPGEVPAQFRKAVEDYYRALAKKRQ